MTEIKAEGTTGYLLMTPSGARVFRVYSRDGKNGEYVDFDLAAEDIKVTIHSRFVSLYSDDPNQRNRIDWSSSYLKHARPEQP